MNMGSPPNKLPHWMTEEEKQKNSANRSVLEQNLPFLEFPGSVIYSYNASDCSLLAEDIISMLPDGAVLGFDIEWTPVFTKGKEGKVALIQLCESEEKCYLFHISSMSNFPGGLKRLLEDNHIKKIGVGIEGDKWKLMRDFEVNLGDLVDLADLANKKLRCKEIWSLNDLVKHLFHKQLLKEKLVRCGNWEEFPLTEEQKLYAATDAYAGFLIYKKLMTMSSDKKLQISIEKDGILLSSEIKKELATMSEEMIDLTDHLPCTLDKSINIQRISEILSGLSENIKALRRVLLLDSACQMELGDAENSGKITRNKEKLETSELPSKLIRESNDHVDHLDHFQNDILVEDEEEPNNKNQAEDVSNERTKAAGEYGYLMSLDITEYELQMLERQAEEELLNEAACKSEDLSFTENEGKSLCVIESDDEFEMEMIKSLENIDKHDMDVGDSHLDKLKKENDMIVDYDDEDDEIEEEEESWDSSLPGPNSKQTACLKMYFGHSNFKLVQWKVISSVLQDRRDNLVVMATGYGKSLCFQFPPVYTGGTGIVISPLISLMEDQVLQLEMSGVQACLLGSAQSKNIRGDIKAGHYRVVYITPEFCSGNLTWLEELDQTIVITVFTNLAPKYHDILKTFTTKMRWIIQNVPIIALTATASPSIRKDIVDCLNLKNPQITCTSFDRPNLYLEVGRKTGNIIRDLKQFLIKKDTSTYEFEGPSIVYCPSRKITEQVSAELMKLNLACGTYHAGMGIKERRNIHHKFMRDEIQCIVATVAFGMGINKADIRTVIHYGAPKEMESYYQEIGRAGRDGLPASCHVLWTPADLSFNRSDHKNLEHLQTAKKLNQRQIRWALFFSRFNFKVCDCFYHFLEPLPCRERLNLWENICIVEKEDSFEDFGQQAYKLMSAVCALNERFGMGVPVLFLRGSNSQRVPDRYRTHALFGSGKDWPENLWKALGRSLVLEGFLKEVSGINKFSTICTLSAKGKDWLCKAKENSSPKLLLLMNEDLYLKTPSCNIVEALPESKNNCTCIYSFSYNVCVLSLIQSKTSLHEMFAYQGASNTSRGSTLSSKSNATVQLPLPLAPVSPTVPAVSQREKELQTALYGKLVAARQKLANEKDIPPAVLATNKVLVDMTTIRPTTIESIKRIDGVSEAKSAMLESLLIMIKEFSQTNNLQTDIFKTSGSQDQPNIILQKRSECGTLTESERVTYTLFQEKNMSLRSVCESRSLPLTVVGTHLSQALKADYPVDLERAGLTPEIQEMITKIIQNPPINSDVTQMKAIRTLVPAHVEMYLIRMTVMLLEKQHRNQPLNQQNDPDSQISSQVLGCLQSSAGSSQKKEENIMWIDAKVCKQNYKKGTN
uniref:DNA 3'-5' helicase n=1 Tax=Anolis carolinensis TaxID=28377 RepID=H9G760_ANOCA